MAGGSDRLSCDIVIRPTITVILSAAKNPCAKRIGRQADRGFLEAWVLVGKMKHASIDGAVFDVGQCFVELAGTFGRDLEVILARHARAEFEPDSLVQIWGDRIASFWPDGDTIIAVETLVLSAPGWQGPMTHFEVINAEKWRAFSSLFERDEFQPALEWPEPRYLRAQIDPEENINVLRSMHHALLVGNQ